MSVKIGVFRSGPITPRQQDLRAQLELPQLQTFLGVNGGGGEGGGLAGGGSLETQIFSNIARKGYQG